MTKVVLYSDDISPPCRAVLMTAHAIGLKLDIKETSLTNMDNLTEEFLKVNSQHQVPVIDDNGFILADSQAIASYLVDKYAEDDSLYPKDLQKRAQVNRFLYFNSSTLFAAEKNTFRPIFQQGAKSFAEDKVEAMKEAYEFLNKFLEGKKWLVGNSYTIADISCLATATSGTIVVNLNEYPNVEAWIQRCGEEIPGYKEINVPGVNSLHSLLRSFF